MHAIEREHGRFAVVKPKVKFAVNNNFNTTIANQFSRIIGDKEYELKDHLGNIRVTLSDARENSTTAVVTSATSYLPFGMVEPNVFTSAGNHRFGFGGMEKDDDWKGDGNSIDFGARIYDPRIGRWLSRDAKESEYPGVSTYSYSYNNPLFYTDPDGNSIVSVILKKAAKEGFKVAIKKVIKEVIEQKIKDYAKKGLKEQAKQFAKDAANIVDDLETLDGAWWEVAIEFVPIAGDIYGGTKFAKQVSTILHKVDVLEKKIDDASKKVGAAVETAVETVGDVEKKAKQFKINKQAGKLHEANVFDDLMKNLKPTEDILPQASFRLSNGKMARPDFTIVNKEDKSIVKIIDAKSGNAKKSKNQKTLEKEGGTLTGKNSKSYKGTSTPPTNIETR